MRRRAKQLIFNNIRIGSIKISGKYKGSVEVNIKLHARLYENKDWTWEKLQKNLINDYLKALVFSSKGKDSTDEAESNTPSKSLSVLKSFKGFTTKKHDNQFLSKETKNKKNKKSRK